MYFFWNIQYVFLVDVVPLEVWFVHVFWIDYSVPHSATFGFKFNLAVLSFWGLAPGFSTDFYFWLLFVAFSVGFSFWSLCPMLHVGFPF